MSYDLYSDRLSHKSADRLSHKSGTSLSSTRRRNAELARIRLKFADEEIALKKAQAEMEYKQNVIKMDYVIYAMTDTIQAFKKLMATVFPVLTTVKYAQICKAA